MTSPRGEPTADELRDLAESLVASWGVGELRVRLRDYPPAQVVTVSALAAHAYRACSASLLLLGNGYALESAPSVRCAFEFAVTAHWAAQIPEATALLIREAYKKRLPLAKLLQAIQWGDLTDDDLAAVEADIVAYDFLGKRGHSFESVCGDLEGGSTLYAMYRGQSGFSHPTALMVDEYATPDESSPIGATRSLTPRRNEPELWLWTVCAALTIAGRAVDFINVNKSRRTQLRLAADRLGIPRQLHPSAAWQKADRTPSGFRQGEVPRPRPS